MLRSASTRWFEVLCPRAESVAAVAALAATGAVELEIRAYEAFPIQHLAAPLGAYQSLLIRYGRYWSRGRLHRQALTESPALVLQRALLRIDAWRREADPLIDTLQSCEEELTRLQRLAQVLERIASSRLDLDAVTHGGPVLGTYCCILPPEADPRFPDWVIPRGIPWEGGRCFLLLGPADRLDDIKHLVHAVRGRIIERPPWLQGDTRHCLDLIGQRRRALSTQVVLLYAELDTLFEDYDLDHVLGEVSGLAWFATHVGGLELAGEHLVWVTGWTDDLRGHRLADALDHARTHALLRFRPPPAGMRPPQVLDNPPWMRPFELFARAFGVPGSDEADPTPVVAVIVPLLFGYMFGDLGQGAVLLGLGWWFARRGLELARMLILCGAAAMGFGLLFGSLFGVEDLIPALWLHPLQEPISVLAVPLVFAVGLLSLGQLLDGLGALRRGELGRWLLRDLGFLVMYLGLTSLPFTTALGWLAPIGASWSLLGAFLVQRNLIGALAAIGHLLESGVQVMVNTLSFARVGAFALAHAALSAAVVSMAQPAPGWAAALILILGNALIIALEGLVVGVQTTRLVLFEFFNRFLRGTGRVFKPLPAPPPVVEAVA